ncbi:L,D-transpeptidase family protein [Streptomyces endophytica]|uniref:L,D-transpeptidase family protein n=1 Tax=Streptomyces endophytica TaxID=2991496 RepID=A0ABY6PAN9_9ACTN|nr:L,D-transpeptidase family protein [Streptomyces endophytica]UZJ30851.1 L,D-transpeptidase family protein [Streptomyces endophytica]
MKRTLVALLAGASLFPLAGPPAVAVAPSAARPAASAGYAPAARNAALDLVPGIPRSARRPAPGGRQLHIEYVPRSEAGSRAGRCIRSAGPFQRQAERYLRRRADGRQSAGDCRAIRRFQQRHRIAPATGYAGPVTGAVVRLLRARKDPNRAGHCPVRQERTACVDLDRQVMWVQQAGRVIFDPVPIRSGQPTMETRTGTYRIYLRRRYHISNLYHTPMPFAQFFDRGEAFHGVDDDIYEGLGSHGCINLTWSDARNLWYLLKKHDLVYVWGRKPSG